jgi:beta-glucosidase
MRHRIRETCRATFIAVASAAFALSLAAGAGCATAVKTENAAPTAPAAPDSAAQTPVCKATPDPIEARVDAWLAAMTLDEKAALVAGTGFDTVGVPRLHIPSLRMTDGPIGVRVGKATEFPASVLLAASFDPALSERIGAAIARETKAHGKNVILGPAVNIVRSPLNGRDFEYLSEDPALAARMAVGYIRGVQSQGVMATVKHFAANNQETERMTIDAQVDARTLHEIYLPAFEAAVKEAGVWAVMCAYNRLNGPYACESPTLLDEILRRDWGFRGLVMSDWTATHSLAPAMRAGLDLEMPSAEFFKPAAIRKAFEQQALTTEVLDNAVRRQLRVIAALHLDDDATVRPEGTDTIEHRALNRVAAREGFVLLKNDQSILPLDARKLRRIAVVGPRGDHLDGGGGSAHVEATHQVTLVQALRQALGNKVRVDYAPGEITLDGLAPIPPSVLKPPAGHDGQGLLGEYFDNRNHAGAPKLSRVDSTVNNHWELNAPAPGFPEDNFSVRWTGTLTPPKSGLTMLAIRSDDGARLYLDGKLLIDNWGEHPPTLKTTEIELVGGKAYTIRLDYYESIIGASVELLWQRAEKDPMGRVAEVARGADVVIAAVGDGMGDETEGLDRPSLALPGRQDAIVRAAAAVNPRIVVVTTTGAAVAMPWLDKAKAVLHGWFPGQEGGTAMADVLLGEVSPSGKLPVTFPKRLEDEPWFGNFPGDKGKVHYKEGTLVGYRWYDTRKLDPLFPFGHGLSYTSFAYRDLKVSAWDPQQGVTVQFVVKNTGARRGAEVAQLYVHAPSGAIERAEQELRAFSRVDLDKGEERMVVLRLPPRAFAFYDGHTDDGWTVSPGEYEVRAAASSRDVRLRATVTVPAK